MPLRTALIYAAGACAWIVLSDLAVTMAFGSTATELWADIGKGLLFVAASAGLLYVLLRQILRREAAIWSDLEASHERFNSAVSHMPFIFAIYDSDRRFRFLNTMGLLTAGKTLDEVIGRRDEEVFPLEMVNAYLPMLTRALEKGHPQTEVVDIAMPSGHMHLAYTFTPLLNADGSVREVLAVTNDMTVVVRNERHTRRLNRTLAAVSAANSVLVRATDEAGLLRDFCAELAAQTQRRLVWVGFVEGAQGQLRVASEAGPAAGLVAGIRPGDTVEPADYCLCTMAVQHQQAVICHDFQTEARFAPCRERAQAAGLRSGVGLPLRDDGRILGAMCLYAAEPERFDEEEVKLLAELAEDLAFGLTALRQKRELAQALARLRESEERLRMLKLVIDQSPSVAYVARIEPGWPVEFVSDNVARFGYQPAEFTSGQIKLSTVAHPEDFPRIAAESDQAVTEGKVEFAQEYRVFNARGETRWVQDHCSVVRNAAGQATHFQGVITDITERKQAEEELCAAHAFSANLMQTANVIVLGLDAQGCIRIFNEAAERITGYRREELTGVNWFETLVPKERYPSVWAEFKRLTAGETAKPFENPILTKAGEERHILWQNSQIRAKGQVVTTISFGNDITERKRAEAHLRDAVAYLGTLIEAAPIAVISYDETGQARTANAAAAQMTGGTVEQLLSLNFRQIKSWQASGLLAAAELALASRQPEQLESRFTTTFGKEVWLSSQFVPFQRGDAWHLLLIQTDIAERKRNTAQLRLQSAALDAAANAIVISDAQGVIQWANPAFTKSTGYPLAEVIGQSTRLLKSGAHPREFYEGMWKTILAGHVWHGEMRNRRKDGSLYDEEMTIAPVPDSEGRITHFIAIKQDITERKSLEKQFLRAQRLEGIGLLAGGIAHDLNNVLAPILMGADLLKMQAANDQTARQLDGIVQSARRGADIVKQVLTFARGVEGERVLLHPKHIIKEMVRMARETFPPNLQLRVDVPNDLWPMVGDPTQIHQVLLNLSVNARDAMPDGGELSYGARNMEVDTALAHANTGAKPGPHIVLRVQDTGTGMTPEVMERIFEPFYTTKELGKGTGLGLSTALGIVRSHGGFVSVESTLGRGTTFEVHLPAKPQAASAAAAALPEPIPLGTGEMVLVVDDEADILQVTRAMLERHGYRVLTASDGTAALTELSQHLGEVKLIVTDIMMPFMDGVQLIRAVHRLSPGLRVIASSGVLGMPGQKDRTDEVRALGVKHILHKPYSVETFLRTVHAELHPVGPVA
ncbi:MAG: PAS domain S-box protein [Limisphaerales bacterium]